jgi:hypothetical protein
MIHFSARIADDTNAYGQVTLMEETEQSWECLVMRSDYISGPFRDRQTHLFLCEVARRAEDCN